MASFTACIERQGVHSYWRRHGGPALNQKLIVSVIDNTIFMCCAIYSPHPAAQAARTDSSAAEVRIALGKRDGVAWPITAARMCLHTEMPPPLLSVKVPPISQSRTRLENGLAAEVLADGTSTSSSSGGMCIKAEYANAGHVQFQASNRTS